ncbi:MAG: hypothetical protein H7282_09080 [Cytophagaceae bacterium]|nr:hypothetical protein [Cytophagaceae bacterium]
MAPSFADLVVSSMVVNSINANTLGYTYTISNNGVSTLNLDRFYFQFMYHKIVYTMVQMLLPVDLYLVVLP